MRISLLATPLLFLLSLICFQAEAADAVDIGLRRELFVDDYLIDKTRDVQRMLNRPTPREVAIVHDEPWEGAASYYHSVFQDGDIYRMYYRGCNWNSVKKKVHENICYAQSKDGIHWTKPDLGLIPLGGSKHNNLLWSRGGPVKFPADIWRSLGSGAVNFSAFKDTNPACAADAKYKALGGDPFVGMYAFKSADGIRWSMLAEKAVIPPGGFQSKFDSQSTMFWDPLRGCYVSFHKACSKSPKGKWIRDLITCTSKDFVHWSEPARLKYPGAPIEHLYTNQIMPYPRAPHIYVGFPKRFMPSRKPVGTAAEPGVSDVVFMSSRDGVHFNRWGEAFIRPGPQIERWIHRNNFMAWGIVTTKSALAGSPDELSFYSVEGSGEGDNNKMRRYTLRQDGFVSVRAPLSGGELLTKPLIFEGDRLAINFSTSAAGSIRVEIQDARGKPLPGFSLSDSTELLGDQIDQVVSWKGGSDVGKLAGKTVRLRFFIKDADLYAIQFQKKDK